MVVEDVAEHLELDRELGATGLGACRGGGEKLDQDVVSGPVPVPQPVEQRLGLSPSWVRLQGQQRGRAGGLQQALAHSSWDCRARRERVPTHNRRRDGTPRRLDHRTLTHQATLANRAAEDNRSQDDCDQT